MDDYNILEEKWIPCLSMENILNRHSIRDVFNNACNLREIHAQSPLVTISIYRLLLTILHRVFGPKDSDEWIELYNYGSFDYERISDYLRKWSNRFCLFSDTHPFYQVNNFPRDKTSRCSKLQLECASGNNVTLFDHSYESSNNSIPPEDAVCFLLASQNYEVTGKSASGYRKSAPLINGLQVLVFGRSIWEILLLNLVIYNGNDRPFDHKGQDSPIWERDEYNFIENPKTKKPNGYLEYLTFQNRFIQLFRDENSSNALVNEVGISQGNKLPDNWLNDPFMVYIKQNNDEIKPLKLRSARAAWRDYHSLLGVNPRSKQSPNVELINYHVVRDILPAKVSLSLNVFGVESDKGKINLWRHERFPLSVDIFDDNDISNRIIEAIALAESARDMLLNALYSLNIELHHFSKLKKNDKKALDPGAVEQHYWSRLELPFISFIEGLAKHSNSGDNDSWSNQVMTVTKESFQLAAKSLRFTGRAIKGIALADMALNKKLNNLMTLEVSQL